MACVAFFDMTSIDTEKSTDKKNLNYNLKLQDHQTNKRQKKGEVKEKQSYHNLLCDQFLFSQSTVIK